jgi:DNA-binding NtrC family response regulator
MSANLSAGTDAARATVLVVEDEAHLAAGLKLNLELDGYRVVVARSLRDAAAQLVKATASASSCATAANTCR